MKRVRTAISFLLVAALMAGNMAASVVAADDPMAAENDSIFGEVTDRDTQTLQVNTEPTEKTGADQDAANAETVSDGASAETVPEDAIPDETVSEEIVAEDIVSEETAAEEVPAQTEPEKKSDNKTSTRKGMPLYFQTDYPDTLFADSTLAKSGCSMTALAMVASYMTGYDYTPVDLARYFGGVAENNIARLEKGSETLGLPFYKAENWHVAQEAVKQGKIAIVLMGPKSLFTDSQHFIVVTGVNEEGKYLVNDPYEPNYDHWKMKVCFKEGFDSVDIAYGYSGAWVYDKDAITEKPEFYYEPDIDRSNPRYPDIQLTGEEMILLAKVVWVEARGESAEGQQAVAEVILNRIVSDRFPDTLRDVIFSEGQFRSVEFLKDADPHQAQYDAIDRAIYGPYILPEDVVHFATFKTSDNVWGKLGGHYFCYAAD